jgi:hypothetical protein
MTADDVTKILDRALEDETYLARLLSDPAGAAGELNATMTDEEIATIRKMSADELKQFAAEHKSSTDPAKRRAAC